MNFLNTALLWALPAALLPLIIHLLNRLRYRSVNWAAVMFLVSATRSSTRHARLRQLLVLLARILVLFCFLFALARPVVGGWLGLTIAGAPDTIMILLDRSASMEGTDPRRQTSKRAHALALISQAAKETSASSRFVLVENVLKTPQELGSAANLSALALAGPTDTAADIPAMLRAAVDAMIEDQTGRTELWLASDFQESNWRPDSKEWQGLVAQMGSLPQDIRIRILDLHESYDRNAAVNLVSADRRRGASGNQLDLALDIQRIKEGPETIPMILTLDDARAQVDLALRSQQFRFSQAFDLAEEATSGGWGMIELPADENPRDNTCYFAYAGDVHLSAALVSDDVAAARPLRLAIAPDPERLNVSCDVISPADWNDSMLQDLALLVWHASPPSTQDIEAVAAFVKSGGTVLYLPTTAQAKTNASPPGFGIQWGKTETADADKPFRVTTWEEHDGPLARTASGDNLPLGRLAVARRQRPLWNAEQDEAWHPLASYSDGQPFLLRRSMGKGRIFLCTSLPRDDWSNLAEGLILVPVLQRMLANGAGRLTHTEIAACGDWQPPLSSGAWAPVSAQAAADYRWHAGVYQNGRHRVALNVPSRELDPVTLETDAVSSLFGDLSVQIMEKIGERNTDRLQSEIWHIFIYAALACMILESSLLLQERGRARKKKDGTSA